MDTVKKIKEIFAENSEGEIVLPNFQRGFEWKVNDQKKLLATVLSQLPIGSILLLAGKKNDFAARPLCYNDDTFKQKDDCVYLLDGQQRMSSLRALFSDLLGTKADWKGNYEKLYKNLRYRWFIDVKKIETVDIFGYEKLRFEEKNIIKFEPGQFLENIVEVKITKQNKNEWYHPDFDKDKEGKIALGNKLKSSIAHYASAAGLVPLYDIDNAINNSEKSLLEYTLEEIALERIKVLKAEVADGDKTITEILGHMNSDIEEYEKNKDEDRLNLAWSSLAADWRKNLLDYLKNLLNQEMHAIKLPADEIGRATAIFESINRGGISLNTYDLVVAKAARIRSERALTPKIIDQLKKEIVLSDALLDTVRGDKVRSWTSLNMKTVEDNKMASSIRDQFLNLLSIFSHTNYGEFTNLKIELIKKDKHLAVTSEQIYENTEVTIESLIRACAFLQYRAGKININVLNYNLMLLPLAYAFRSDDIWNSRAAIAKLEYWYWASLFGGSYRERQNQRCIDDIRELYSWLKKEEEAGDEEKVNENPFKNRFANILNYEGYSTKEVLLNKDEDNTIPLAIHNGILEYVLSTQPKDFYPHKEITLNTWEIAIKKRVLFHDEESRDISVEDHHIYPLGANLPIGESSKEIRNKSRHILNSSLNRTYISEYANSLIRDKSPSQYFSYLPKTTMWTHSINSWEWKENEEEINNEFYEQILTTRYNKLLENITTELVNLLGVRD